MTTEKDLVNGMYWKLEVFCTTMHIILEIHISYINYNV